MEGWRIFQSCDLRGSYKKEEFIHLVSQMPQEQFNKFCSEYWALLHFYDSHVNTYCTSDKDIVDKYPRAFRRLAPIEGDLARQFEKIF